MHHLQEVVDGTDGCVKGLDKGLNCLVMVCQQGWRAFDCGAVNRQVGHHRGCGAAFMKVSMCCLGANGETSAFGAL